MMVNYPIDAYLRKHGWNVAVNSTARRRLVGVANGLINRNTKNDGNGDKALWSLNENLSTFA
jgi:hypothetical protein